LGKNSKYMILTTIDGMPLFSTIQEALAWAASNGLSGYHMHQYQGQTGYMGGATHGGIISTTNTTTSTTTLSSGGY
jgi:hypothetical protein